MKDGFCELKRGGPSTIVRRRAKTGAVSLIPGTVSFNEEEIESEGSIVTVKGTINGQNISTRYAA